MKFPYKLIIFAMIFSMLFAQFGSAFVVYLRPPKMVVHMNVTPGKVSEYEAFVEIQNRNDETISVEFLPQKDLTGKIYFKENPITLEPGQAMNVNFTIKIDEPGVYNEEMVVQYSSENLQIVSLQEDITVIANEVKSNSLISGNVILGLSEMGIGLIFCALILLLIIPYFLLKRVGKWKK